MHPFCSTCLSCLLFVVFPPSIVHYLKKGAKEFVDQNMLRSQRSRRRRKQQRPTSSSCPGPSGSAEEGKQGDSDHETTSSSGGSLTSHEMGLLLLDTPGALSTLGRRTMGVMVKFVLWFLCFHSLSFSKVTNCKDLGLILCFETSYRF